MTKRLLHPPKGVQGFQVGGTDHGHVYEGKGIDCAACVAVVDGWSTDERINDPTLRGPLALPWHDDPVEREHLQAEHHQRLRNASWRIEEVEDGKEEREPEKPKEESQAFQEGKAAAEEGHGRGSNPYDGRSHSGKDWSRGWDAAEK